MRPPLLLLAALVALLVPAALGVLPLSLRYDPDGVTSTNIRCETIDCAQFDGPLHIIGAAENNCAAFIDQGAHVCYVDGTPFACECALPDEPPCYDALLGCDEGVLVVDGAVSFAAAIEDPLACGARGGDARVCDVAPPVQDSDAATKGYVDNALEGCTCEPGGATCYDEYLSCGGGGGGDIYVSTDVYVNGSVFVSGGGDDGDVCALVLDGGRICGVAFPVYANDTATKDYVDTVIESIEHPCYGSALACGPGNVLVVLNATLFRAGVTAMPAGDGVTLNAWGGVVRNLSAPVHPSDAATKEYVDAALDECGCGDAPCYDSALACGPDNTLILTNTTIVRGGLVVMSDEAWTINAWGGTVHNISAPVHPSDAVTKEYVDAALDECGCGDAPCYDSALACGPDNTLVVLNRTVVHGGVAVVPASEGACAVDAGSGVVCNVHAPEAPTDAATKEYVDDALEDCVCAPGPPGPPPSGPTPPCSCAGGACATGALWTKTHASPYSDSDGSGRTYACMPEPTGTTRMWQDVGGPNTLGGMIYDETCIRSYAVPNDAYECFLGSGVSQAQNEDITHTGLFRGCTTLVTTVDVRFAVPPGGAARRDTYAGDVRWAMFIDHEAPALGQAATVHRVSSVHTETHARELSVTASGAPRVLPAGYYKLSVRPVEQFNGNGPLISASAALTCVVLEL